MYRVIKIRDAADENSSKTCATREACSGELGIPTNLCPVEISFLLKMYCLRSVWTGNCAVFVSIPGIVGSFFTYRSSKKRTIIYTTAFESGGTPEFGSIEFSILLNVRQ